MNSPAYVFPGTRLTTFDGYYATDVRRRGRAIDGCPPNYSLSIGAIWQQRRTTESEFQGALVAQRTR